MTIALDRGPSSGWSWAMPVLLLSFILAGCKRAQPEKEEEPPAKSAVSTPSRPTKSAASAGVESRLLQSFKEATVQEPPEGEHCPPDETKGGKSVGKMYEAIAGRNSSGGLWDMIHFLTPDGKPIHYTATLLTDLGSVTIELRPDVAPNHVRSFIALAKAGYYKGLAFDRAVREKIEIDTGKESTETATVDKLEAGCPLGTADPGFGSIGYWLKPEFSDQLSHEEGTVGACLGEVVESAAAKFYITLSKAPWMDGNWTVFGNVTQGIGVLRKIFDKPIKDDYFRPQEPVVIRDLTISSTVGPSAVH